MTGLVAFRVVGKRCLTLLRKGSPVLRYSSIPRAVCAPHLFQEVLDKEVGTTYVPQLPLIIMSSQSTQSPSNVPNAWGAACRPTLLFVAAYALSVTPHEAVQALTGYLLGFNSTLFQMWVNPDLAGAMPRQLATVAAAGPVFSLTVGVTCWLLYQRRFRQKPAALMFLMLAIVGVNSFLGPLTGSALGGDFNLAFTVLDVPKPVRKTPRRVEATGAEPIHPVRFPIAGRSVEALAKFEQVLARRLSLRQPKLSASTRVHG